MFPMNQQAEDLLMGAPSEVSARQLRDLHVRLALPKQKQGRGAEGRLTGQFFGQQVSEPVCR